MRSRNGRRPCPPLGDKAGWIGSGRSGAGAVVRSRERLRLGAIGLEAEFSLFVDDAPARPEEIFGDPRAFVRGQPMHRVGTSYHLPTGGAVYFDSGVIEVTTPLIEIARGCAARAGRSLWEAIVFVRAGLDEWERRSGRRARLAGFSTHYNVSFAKPRTALGPDRTIRKLALLLAYVLPVPVMLLAANRRSTGIGCRPRGNRIEVTADFTPSSPLLIATATLVTGIVREVMTWRSFELSALDRRGVPRIRGFTPVRHTSRTGWLARFDSFPHNPFAENVDRALWQPSGGASGAARPQALREIARRIFARFRRPIARVADPFTLRLIRSVFDGHAPSLLDLPDRPPAYDDVGHLCTWDRLFPKRWLDRSRYERVLIQAISRHPLRIGRDEYTPTGMQGWSRIVFRRETDAARRVFSIDDLVGHLESWERG